VWLIALAVAGAALKIPLGIWFKPLLHSEFGHRFFLLCCQIALLCVVPFALRLNWQLGLPGAPFIRAKLARQKPPGRLRSLIGIALLYDLAAIVVSVLALAVLVLSGVLPLAARRASHASPHSLRTLPFFAFQGQAGRLAVTGLLAAVGAGLSEEIMFRLSVFAIFIWLFRLMLRDRTDRPSRAALWCATIMQAYVFGLAHLNLTSSHAPEDEGADIDRRIGGAADMGRHSSRPALFAAWP
jgi:Type II CAAX prenyl endopeptidase Rce1-like